MRILILCIIIIAVSLKSNGQERLDKYSSYTISNQEIIIKTEKGYGLKIQPYTNYMVRMQYISPGEMFYPDGHYDIVLNHEMGGALNIEERKHLLVLETSPEDGLRIEITKNPIRISFIDKSTGQQLLSESKGIAWENSVIRIDFKYRADQHFLGFGQAPLGYQDYIDLRGQRIRRNYGENAIPGRGAQGNLLVPFYMSSKGYGLYINNTFPNDFSFGQDNQYFISIDTRGAPGQMDYYFIKGPTFQSILNRYTDLTGRPRLIPKAMFGLHLSDNDPKINNEPIDYKWWETMISNHQGAGFPLDHAVFDNDWRPGVTPDKDGQWSGSKFEFNYERFPDPTAFKAFLKERGVTLTLDLNLNNCNDSWGWKERYNMPVQPCNDANANSYPDYTNPEVRNWVWELFWNKALDPGLDYPCDGLWIDEPDGVNNKCMPDSSILFNGRTWGEMKNYYYFLIGKAIVEEGWDNQKRDNHIGEDKRPYVWVRGGTAGGQRYTTHWTGDIHFTRQAYKNQIKSLQVSGLSAYPFFNHDAGGFVEKEPGPNDYTYIQWGMAFGSFTPIWRPHGYGLPRWPLNRSALCQEAAKKYGRLRYQMIPYIYSMAHIAYNTGMPLARPMSIIYPSETEAWGHELQYMWGTEMLVAPGLNLAGKDSLQHIWLPGGNSWYYLWNDSIFAGGQTILFNVKFGEIPVFVKSGAIIPKREFAVSTAKLSDERLILEIFAGANGSFNLFEDDGISERYRTKNEVRHTRILYENQGKITIMPATGSYNGCSVSRDYIIKVHGTDKINQVILNGKALDCVDKSTEMPPQEYYKTENNILHIFTSKYNLNDELILEFR